MDPDRILFQARLIALALLMGVLIYAGVAVWLISEGRLDPLEPEVSRWLVLAWGVASVGASIGWWLFRGRALEQLTSTRGLREIHHGEVEGPGRAFGFLVIAWALAESIGISGVTVGLLTGRGLPLFGGALATALAVALSWPRPEWFSAFRQGRMPGGAGERDDTSWKERG